MLRCRTFVPAWCRVRVGPVVKRVVATLECAVRTIQSVEEVVE